MNLDLDMSENKFMNKFIDIASRIGSQIHLKSLRDAFSTLSPLFIMAGLAVLVNFVVLPWAFSGDSLVVAQQFGGNITQGTLNVAGLLLCPAIAFYLAQNKGYHSPISMAISVLATYLIMMPQEVAVSTVEGEQVIVNGALSYSNLGTGAMFAGIIVGLLATELLLKLSTVKGLKINLGENVPPAVGNAFSLLIPVIITVSVFSLVSVLLSAFFDTDIISLIVTFIQAPLRGISTSLGGYLFLYSLGNFLFTLGIHQTVINGPFTEPFMLQNINENTLAFESGLEPPHILTSSFQTAYAQMGGTGATISLILAILIFSKTKHYRQVAKIGLASGIFEINEPIIYGFPIVFNLPMMIPFVLLPVIQTLIAYFATAMGLVSKTVVMVPWITPPVISGYLATAGDWRASLLQIILIAVGVVVYLPFLKISEAVLNREAQLEG